MDWQTIRRDFRCCERGAYLDTATYGPAPEPSFHAVARALEHWRAGDGKWRDWEDDAERARELLATRLGVAPGCLALLPTVSLAAAQVARELPAPDTGERRDNIVVHEIEFRSNLFPWLAEERRGFDVRVVQSAGGKVGLDAVHEAIDARTAIVAVSSVQSSSGARVDLDALVTRAREVGARLFVDGTQSIGALTCSLEGIDYLACAGYKWLLGPRGGAFLYIAPERVGQMTPIAPGWRAPADPNRTYYGPPLDLADDASRYDQSLAWLTWVGARASLDYLSALEPKLVEERDLALASRFRAGLQRAGHEPLFPASEGSHIVSLRVGDADAAEAALASERIRAAVRGDFLRFSFHFFNDEDDVDAALAALARVPARAQSPV